MAVSLYGPSMSQWTPAPLPEHSSGSCNRRSQEVSDTALTCRSIPELPQNDDQEKVDPLGAHAAAATHREFENYLASLLRDLHGALLMERRQADAKLRLEVKTPKPQQDLAHHRASSSNHFATDVNSANRGLVGTKTSEGVPTLRLSSIVDREFEPEHSVMVPSIENNVSANRGLVGTKTSEGVPTLRLSSIVNRESEPEQSVVVPSIENNDLATTTNSTNRGSIASIALTLSELNSAAMAKIMKLFRIQDIRATLQSSFPSETDKLALFIDQAMGILTILNIALIGISSDLGEGWRGWLAIDIAFAFLFCCEMLVKMWLLGLKRYCSGFDYTWNLLEVALVVLAVAELVIEIALDQSERKSMLPALRIIRCFRIGRLIHIRKMQFFIELSEMLQGTRGGMRTLLWACFLIALPLYSMAILLHETLGKFDTESTKPFHTVSSSFFTVWRCIVAGDCNQEEGKPIFVLVSASYGWGFGLLYVIGMTFMTFHLFNVIVAIHVENIVSAAKYNDLVRKRNRLEDDKMLVAKLHELVQVIVRERAGTSDSSGDEVEFNGKRYRRSNFEAILRSPAISMAKAATLELSPDFFAHLLKEKQFREILADLDVADEDQLGLFESLDIDGSGSLAVPELIKGIKKLRGDPRRSDVVNVGLVVRDIQEMLRKFLIDPTASLQLREQHFRNNLKSAAQR